MSPEGPPAPAPAWIRPARLALLGLAALLYIYTALVLSETHDERAHLHAGVAWLTTGDPHFDPQHPLLRSVLAIPAWLLGAPVPARFIDPITHPAQVAGLYLGRLVALALFLGWAAVVSAWVARRVAPAAGVAALAMLLFEPTLAAHAVFLATDMVFVLPATALAIAALEWARRPRWPLALLVGVLAGMTMLAKYSSILWLGGLAVALAAWLAVSWRDLAGRRAVIVAQIVAAMLVALALVNAAYEFRGFARPLGQLSFESNAMRGLQSAAGWLPLPLPAAWLVGVDHMLSTGTRAAYFAGKIHTDDPSWLYFPLLVLFKPPVVWLLLLVMAVAVVARDPRRLAARHLLYILPAAALFLYSTFLSRLQIGVRHILPVFPMLSLGAVAVLWPMARWRPVVVALVAATAVAGAGRTPHQLASFNMLAGGSEGAWRWFADSNQDWGQGWRAIAQWADEGDITLNFEPVAGETTGWVALRANDLVGLDPAAHERHRFIRENMHRRRFVEPCWHVYKISPSDWEGWAPPP